MRTLLPALVYGALSFAPTLLHTLVVSGLRRIWENTEPRRQSLLPALFLSPLNIDINVVRVAPFLLKHALLFPKPAVVATFVISLALDAINVHVATDSFDLKDGTPDRFLADRRQPLHAAQKLDFRPMRHATR